MGAKKTKKHKESEDISINLPSIPKADISGIGNPVLILALLALIISSAKTLMDEGAVVENSHILLGLIGVASFYFISTSKHELSTYAIPAIILMSALMSFYSNQEGNFLADDFNYFSIAASIFALFFALGHYKILDLEVSAVLALFLATLLIHMVPAQDGMIGNIDPYWQYKWMRGIYDTGYPAEHDDLVYPLFGGIQRSNDPSYVKSNPTFGLDQSKTAMLTPVSYTVLALAFKPAGISLEDTAIIFPGVISALTILLFYLLVSELFTEMRPYNKIAGFIAAFMLMLSPGFGISSVASNCEDDALGMFFMVGGLFLFFASIHRKNILYSFLCGFAFLMLRIGWGGSQYAYMTVGIFGTLYAIVRFLHGKNSIEHLPYIIIPTVIHHLMGVIVHAKGGMPVLHMMVPNALYPTLTAIALSIILEALRLYRGGEKYSVSGTLHDRIICAAEKNITPIALASIVCAIGFFIFVRTPGEWVDWAYHTLLSPSVKSLVHQTVAEQNTLADSLTDYMFAGYGRFGVAFTFALLMIVPMMYMVYRRASTGALFLLSWALPMMYGVYYKSAWAFAASAGITALGASVGLFAAASRKDLDGFRIIGTILLFVVPMLYVPVMGTYQFNKFVGYQVMHMGVTFDRRMWEPNLVWHRDVTAPGDAIVTWWDYGHWITSESQRPVLIDNLQADYYQIQDVARFFVNKTTEEEALEMLTPYEAAYGRNKADWGIKYVTIDWTMIGKGSALHYIATGDIQDVTPGSWKNYVQCEFIQEASSTTDQLKVNPDGSFTRGITLVFGCQNQHAIVFEVSDFEITNTYVITPYRRQIQWNTFSEANDVSILGVQSLMGLNETRLPSILACVSGRLPQQYAGVCSLPQFNTLVWVPQEFNDFMMTRLYLGKYLEEYRQLGYYTREPTPLKHFRQVPDYDGDGLEDGEFSLGFVRSYEVSFEGFANRTN